jgi:hypothetical protein
MQSIAETDTSTYEVETAEQPWSLYESERDSMYERYYQNEALGWKRAWGGGLAKFSSNFKLATPVPSTKRPDTNYYEGSSAPSSRYSYAPAKKKKKRIKIKIKIKLTDSGSQGTLTLPPTTD